MVAFGLIALQGNDFLYFVPAFISMMMFMTTFSYDEYNKWDAYAVTLPLEKKDVVLSKYVGSILLLIVALLGTFLIAFLVGVVNQNFDFEKHFFITWMWWIDFVHSGYFISFIY